MGAERTERVLTENTVQVQVGTLIHGRRQQRLTVADICDFAQALVAAQAPPELEVKARIADKHGIDPYPDRLTVTWGSDLINGQPAPQVQEQEQDL